MFEQADDRLEERQYFTVSTAARFADHSTKWIRRKITEGCFPYLRLPAATETHGQILIPRAEFQQWLESYRIDPNETVNRIVAEVTVGQ